MPFDLTTQTLLMDKVGVINTEIIGTLTKKEIKFPKLIGKTCFAEELKLLMESTRNNVFKPIFSKVQEQHCIAGTINTIH